MTIEKLLRNLFHGYTMNRMEQTDAFNLIKQLQQDVLNEREACAKLVEEFHPESFWLGQMKEAAHLIRARSST